MGNSVEELKDRSIGYWRRKDYRDRVSASIRATSAGKSAEKRSAEAAKRWDTRGRTYPRVIELWNEGKTVSEIAAELKITSVQVRRAKEKARVREKYRHPSAEETKLARSRSHKGRAPAIKGQTHSLETIIKMAEKHRGRPLTLEEKETLSVLSLARQIPILYGKPTLDHLVGEKGRPALPRKKEKYKSEVYYAFLISEKERVLRGDEGLADQPALTIDQLEHFPGNSLGNGLNEELSLWVNECYEREIQRSSLLEKAREITARYNRKPLDFLLSEDGVEMPVDRGEVVFLETFYGLRVDCAERTRECRENGSRIGLSPKEIEEAYADDPEIYERLRPQIEIITAKTRLQVAAGNKSPDSSESFRRAKEFIVWSATPRDNL